MKRSVPTLVLLALSASCGAPQQEQPPTVTRRRATAMSNNVSRDDHSRCDARLPRRTASEYDTNADGVPDVRKVYEMVGEGREQRAVLVCREVDLNHDGVKDLFRFYNAEGRTLREEEDHDFDGHIDVVTYFEGGEVVRREYDSDHDGFVDMRVLFRERRPWRMERRRAARQSQEFQPDYWEYYDPQGHVVRIGWDENGDGRADRWDRTDRVAPTRDNAAEGARNAAPASADGGVAAVEAGAAPAAAH